MPWCISNRFEATAKKGLEAELWTVEVFRTCQKYRISRSMFAMKNLNRRDLCIALPALAALGQLAAEAQNASAAGQPQLIHSEIFHYDKLPVTNYANGGSGRAVVHGNLATGEFVEVHETILPAGMMPHAPHRHTHSEFLLIRDGRLEVVSEGQSGEIGPGDVILTASGVLHSLKNIGDTPAHYFVVAVGVQKMLP